MKSGKLKTVPTQREGGIQAETPAERELLAAFRIMDSHDAACTLVTARGAARRSRPQLRMIVGGTQ